MLVVVFDRKGPEIKIISDGKKNKFKYELGSFQGVLKVKNQWGWYKKRYLGSNKQIIILLINISNFNPKLYTFISKRDVFHP